MVVAMRLLRVCLVAAVLATIAAVARAECVPAPELATYQTAAPLNYAAGRLAADRIGRVVAPVSVNGQGPFRFIVDTGANRSVLSVALSQRLGLTPSGVADVHSVHGVVSAPIVQVASLNYGGIALNAAELPLLEGGVLAGEQGLLGVDGMSNRRLRLDFRRNCIEISSAEQRLRAPSWTTIRGRMRFGHLVVIEGRVRRLSVNLLIDTGSDTSLANLALRDALNGRTRRNPDGGLVYTAGEPVMLDDFIHIPRLSIGPIDVDRVNAFVGDFHIFNLWQLQQEPTLLIGMDVLSQTDEIAIDYRRALVQFRLRQRQAVASRIGN